jgi:hypothetical protein
MTQDTSVEVNSKIVDLDASFEETIEELEERIAPKLASNHNETLVIDLED